MRGGGGELGEEWQGVEGGRGREESGKGGRG